MHGFERNCAENELKDACGCKVWLMMMNACELFMKGMHVQGWKWDAGKWRESHGNDDFWW